MTPSSNLFPGQPRANLIFTESFPLIASAPQLKFTLSKQLIVNHVIKKEKNGYKLTTFRKERKLNSYNLKNIA